MTVQAPTSKLRIFVSSTFTDTHKERNKLLGPVYKKMRSEAEEIGIDFSFIDMRYGVRDENTMDHKTWEACRAELIRCREESAGIFFLSLQGEKYGYQPLPKYIPQKPFDEKIKKWGNKEIKQLAADWYLLDKNQIPPRYVDGGVHASCEGHIFSRPGRRYTLFGPSSCMCVLLCWMHLISHR